MDGQLVCCLDTDFYPRSPCGERHSSNANLRSHRNFYPRSPCGERPVNESASGSTKPNFYPRSPCGERPRAKAHHAAVHVISIHALLAESDRPWAHPDQPLGKFLSTLSLRRATHIPKAHGSAFAFLSTLSLRRATPFSRSGPMTRRYFYPRSPCGERPQFACDLVHQNAISIHALLAESDLKHSLRLWMFSQFLSTLSLRRATLFVVYLICRKRFLSTLSLRRATGKMTG